VYVCMRVCVCELACLCECVCIGAVDTYLGTVKPGYEAP
jgi:hypothetical protein